MKNINLRKMTAFAAALVLSAQSGVCVLNAENSEDTVETVIRESLYETWYDKDNDGFLSDEELTNISSVTLDGSKLKDITSFDFLEKLQNADSLTIENWEEFDYSLVKNIKKAKPFTFVTFKSAAMKKTDEQFPDVTKMQILYTENFDLESLSSFTNLQNLTIGCSSTVKDISALKKLNVKSVYYDGDMNPEDYNKVMEFPDLEIPEGYVSTLNIWPRDFLHGKAMLSVKNTSVAKAANGYPHTADNVEMDGYVHIFAGAAGKTEYEVNDKEGNLIGSGNISVVPDKPSDEPLISEKLPELRIIEPNKYSTYVYVLSEDGGLYTFNKEGTGKIEKIDDNVADFYEYSRANNIRQPDGGKTIRGEFDYKKMNAVLYKDGVLKVDGKALNDPKDYTVISFAERGGYCLCSDGKIRILEFGISAEDQGKDVYSWREPEGQDDIKIKAVAKCYYFDLFPICQLEDGRTVMLEFERFSNKIINITDLGLNITPVNVIKKVFYDDDPVEHDPTYYITDNDNNLYEVKLPDGESEPETRLVAKNVKDLGYIYDKTHTSDYEQLYVAYLGDDNEYYDPSGKNKFENHKQYMVAYDWINSFANPYYSSYNVPYAVTGKGTVIDDNFDYAHMLFSLNDTDCTEKFSCLGNYTSMTHVKDTKGAFFDGKDICILVTREDNTLWKYCVEANTFTRIDPELKAENTKKYGIADIVSMMRYLCGIDDGEDTGWMDINGDGSINILDFMRLKREILKNF